MGRRFESRSIIVPPGIWWRTWDMEMGLGDIPEVPAGTLDDRPNGGPDTVSDIGRFWAIGLSLVTFRRWDERECRWRGRGLSDGVSPVPVAWGLQSASIATDQPYPTSPISDVNNRNFTSRPALDSLSLRPAFFLARPRRTLSQWPLNAGHPSTLPR